MSSAAYTSPAISANSAKEMSFGIVVSHWNREITSSLLKGAERALQKKGARKQDIIIKYVPGSFEIPLAAQFFAETTNVDAVICLGCLIKGETPHFDFIAQAVANGLIKVNLDFNKPVIFGILTTDNLKQARERAGGKLGNKGEEAALTAINMVEMKKKFLM